MATETEGIVTQVFDSFARALGIANGFRGIFVWALSIGGLLALGVIISGGILYIASAGNASLQKDAKDRIFNAVFGLLILAGSFVILNTINPAILSTPRI
jgi:hypothetical protein